MKHSDALFEKFAADWEGYNHHPFVQGMADGTLPKEKFQFFMTQDHLYLVQYAKVFALGVLKAEDEADMRLFAGLISATLDVEGALHKSYLAKLGVTNEELAAAKPTLVTESYTNYMIAVAEKGGLPEIMAAVLACSWTYKLIGDYLEQLPGAAEQEFYGPWVRQYMGEEYRSANDLMIAMFDRYTEGVDEAHLERLFDIVEACTRYEFLFWDAAWAQNGDMAVPGAE